jgi:hypothetical protein
MYTITGHSVDGTHRPWSITFYVNLSEDELKSAVEGKLEELKGVCEIVRDSGGVGIRLFNVESDSKFKDAVGTLAKIFNIERYVADRLDEIELEEDEVDDEEPDDEYKEYRMLKRILGRE